MSIPYNIKKLLISVEPISSFLYYMIKRMLMCMLSIDILFYLSNSHKVFFKDKQRYKTFAA